MAASLSNHSVLTHLRPSSSSSSPKTLPFPRTTLSFRRRFHRPLGFPYSDGPLSAKASRFVSPLTASSMGGGGERVSAGSDEESETGAADGRKRINLKAILRVYKEAILIGDRETAAQIEARIGVIGNDMEELAEKVSTLTAEMKSGKEKYIRLQADFDNFRKRSEKERLSVRSNAQGEVIESLLPMVDNFERAKQQLRPETDTEKKIDASYQGIYKQFVEIMRSLRVAVVPTVGKPFDPLLHEAIAREESFEFKEGIVIQEFCRGFRLGDRLLRPAMVKVSSGPGRKAGPATAATTAAAAGVDE